MGVEATTVDGGKEVENAEGVVSETVTVWVAVCATEGLEEPPWMVAETADAGSTLLRAEGTAEVAGGAMAIDAAGEAADVTSDPTNVESVVWIGEIEGAEDERGEDVGRAEDAKGVEDGVSVPGWDLGAISTVLVPVAGKDTSVLLVVCEAGAEDVTLGVVAISTEGTGYIRLVLVLVT